MVFSSCSRKDLEASLEKGVGMCLFNLPEVKQAFGGPKCGNGYVEEGEECDCGEPEVRGVSWPRSRGRARAEGQEHGALARLDGRAGWTARSKVLQGHPEQAPQPGRCLRF